MSIYTKLYRIQKDIRTSIREAEVGTYASGAAFFLFLSLIPMVMIVSSILPHEVVSRQDMVNISQAVVPEKIYRFLLGIVEGYHGNNVTLLSVSALVVVWSASKGVLALIRGLNHIYEVEESRGYILLRLKASFYTIFLLLAVLLSAGILVFGNTLAEWIIPDSGMAASLWKVFGGIRHIFVAGMISVVFCTMYSLLPNNQLTWKEHYPGAVFTSVFWTLYSFGFSIYIDYFGGFSMYGSLTTIVIVMIWLYFCMYIFFGGALVNKWIVDGYIDDYIS
ncbi:MAG: YihY/virulence factor BrkB family protein [Lachnospiraceae bacterium]|nr:YihY/virulence factor BrkB family protein [Lachnospiraceae bacterium]MBO5145311.1 YihY/virulence factor BrkB family protein [Lachnospiraceae bacterium]